MKIELPEKLEKYAILDEKQEKIKRFECPICNFDTRSWGIANALVIE
jgi:hypothetical protein